MNGVGVIYSEGVSALNWGNILQKIRSDFEEFIEKDGGWKFLQEDASDDESGGEDSDALDPEFEDDGSDSSSEDDESDNSDEDSDEDDSSADDYDSEESENLSWDAQERKAREEDR